MKLFNPSEIEVIRGSDQPLKTFWVFWCIKESAYKAWLRQTQSKPVYNPAAFNIIEYRKSINQINSNVSIDGFSFSIKTEVTADYIYSYCNSTSVFNEIYTQDKWIIYNTQLIEQGWVFKKEQFGIPYLELKQGNEKRPLSKTHDGRFVAISYAYPKNH